MSKGSFYFWAFLCIFANQKSLEKMEKGDKVYLDGKTCCILLAINGILSEVSDGEEKLVVFTFRLKLKRS